jgi:hypothetical protein
MYSKYSKITENVVKPPECAPLRALSILLLPSSYSFKLRGLSPRANYTDREGPLLVDVVNAKLLRTEGATWSA